ncbi:hypothetical protein C368_04603 [Cryptococcus neoformans 125.91]|nr:hypothetical protein C368_04603 [Cryptococcus neoformans var. grubii 125.91]
MVAAAGRRSSFPSSPTSHHSFLTPSVFDKVKSAWTAFFSKFGFGKGKKDKDEAMLLPASPRISESFLSFVSSLAPYPVSTRVQQPTIDSRVSYPSSEVPVLNPIQPHEAIPIIAITNASSGSLPSPSPIFSPGPSQDSIKMAKGPTFPESIYADLRHNKHISTARTLKRVTWTRHFIKETLTDASRVENAQIKGTDKPIPRVDFESILRSFGEPEDDQISVALMIDQEYEHEHEHLINNYQSVECQPRADLLPTDALGRQRIPYLINYRMRTMMPSLKQVSVHTPTLEHVAYVVIIEGSESLFLDSQPYDHECRILARWPKETYHSSISSTDIPISQRQERVDPYNSSPNHSIASLPSWYSYFTNNVDNFLQDQQDMQDEQERPLLPSNSSTNSISGLLSSINWLPLINSHDNGNRLISTQTAEQDYSRLCKSPGTTQGRPRNKVGYRGGEMFAQSPLEALEVWKKEAIFRPTFENESDRQGGDENEGNNGKVIGSISESASGQEKEVGQKDHDDERRVLLEWTAPGETERWQPFAEFGEFGFRHDYQAFRPKIPFSLGESDVKPRIPLSQLSIKSNLVKDNVDHPQGTMPTHEHRLPSIKFPKRTRYTKMNAREEQIANSAKNELKSRWSRRLGGALRM